MTQRVKRRERRRRQDERQAKLDALAALAGAVDRFLLGSTAGSFGVSVVRLPSVRGCPHDGMGEGPGLRLCPACSARVLVGIDAGPPPTVAAASINGRPFEGTIDFSPGLVSLRPADEKKGQGT